MDDPDRRKAMHRAIAVRLPRAFVVLRHATSNQG
jgi:hypothetical protein